MKVWSHYNLLGIVHCCQDWCYSNRCWELEGGCDVQDVAHTIVLKIFLLDGEVSDGGAKYRVWYAAIVRSAPPN